MFLFLSYSFGIKTMIKISSFTPVDPSKTIPNSRPEWAKSITVFRPKRRKNPGHLGGTYLYGLYKGIPPPPLPQVLQNKDSETVVVGRLGAERYKHSWCGTLITTNRVFFSNFSYFSCKRGNYMTFLFVVLLFLFFCLLSAFVHLFPESVLF